MLLPDVMASLQLNTSQATEVGPSESLVPMHLAQHVHLEGVEPLRPQYWVLGPWHLQVLAAGTRHTIAVA